MRETQTKSILAKRYTSPASPTNNIAFSRQSVDARVCAKRELVVALESVNPIFSVPTPAEHANTSKIGQTKKKSQNQLQKELKKEAKNEENRVRAIETMEKKALEKAKKAEAETKLEADAKMANAL